MQKVVVDDVIRKFLIMKCNCSSDLCIDISSDIQCSPKSIMIVNVILKGEQASTLWNETNAILRGGAVAIESMGISYSLSCVVKTLCPEVEINTTNIPSIVPVQNNINDTNKTDNSIVIVAIGVPLLLFGLFVLFVVAIVYWSTKKNCSPSNSDKANECSKMHHIEDGNLDNVMTSSNERQSPLSFIVAAKNCKTITTGSSRSSSLMCHNFIHEEHTDSSADSGVGSPGHNELFHPSGLNHDECNVYPCSDQLLPSQSITPSIKSPEADPKLLALSDQAQPSLLEYSKSEPESVEDD